VLTSQSLHHTIRFLGYNILIASMLPPTFQESSFALFSFSIYLYKLNFPNSTLHTLSFSATKCKPPPRSSYTNLLYSLVPQDLFKHNQKTKMAAKRFLDDSDQDNNGDKRMRPTTRPSFASYVPFNQLHVL